jgi:hypothetical protein
MIETGTSTDTIAVPARFNGPRESGNGGFSSGLVAGLIDGPAEVSLRSPVPLDTPLAVERTQHGEVMVRHGSTLVAGARPAAELDLAVPAPVDPDEARRAAARYRGSGYDLLSHCYVCGPERVDTFEVFPGPVDGREIVATPWTPPCWSADTVGHVRPEHIWGALDCPTYFASYVNEPFGLSMLARMTVRIDAAVVADTEHVIMAWPIGTDGRKRHAGAAVLSADGEVLAVAKALLIELRAD